MPDDDFEDRLRRSAGTPTNAAKHALAEQKAEHEAEWDRDEPFRKDLFVRYAERIYPIIQEKLPWAQAIAGERKHEITERPTVPNDREILAQRWFMLKPEDEHIQRARLVLFSTTPDHFPSESPREARLSQPI
jgi:hypothetical protein